MKLPKKLPLKEFNQIYAKIPRLCIDLIIQTKDGVVLSKRDISPAKGKWHLPGGTVYFNEKLTDTIDRVSQEETGLKVKIVKLLDPIEYFKGNVIGHTVGLAIKVIPVAGKLRGSYQGKEIKYFKICPTNTVEEQEIYLKENKLIK